MINPSMSQDPAARPLYCIAHITVNDAAGYGQYEKGFSPILNPHDARFLTFDEEVTALDGERTKGRTVMIEFDSEEVLMAWRNSPEYFELAKLRQASVTTHSVSVVHSLPAR